MFVALGLLIVTVSACGDGNDERSACVLHADCSSSPEALSLGRCAPEIACVEGGCMAWCAERCSVAREDVNPCTTEGWICAESQSAGTTEFAVCRATEISCSSASDCPKYLPKGDGAWTCESDVCRFPGFAYAYENQ